MTLLPELRPTEAVQLVVPVAVPEPPSELLQETEATATLSDAVPPRLSGVLPARYVGPAVGVVMATVGTVLSRVTVRTFVAVFPAVSVAVTVMTLVPATRAMPVMVQEVVPDGVPTAPLAELSAVTVAT